MVDDILENCVGTRLIMRREYLAREEVKRVLKFYAIFRCGLYVHENEVCSLLVTRVRIQLGYTYLMEGKRTWLRAILHKSLNS